MFDHCLSTSRLGYINSVSEFSSLTKNHVYLADPWWCLGYFQFYVKIIDPQCKSWALSFFILVELSYIGFLRFPVALFSPLPIHISICSKLKFIILRTIPLLFKEHCSIVHLSVGHLFADQLQLMMAKELPVERLTSSWSMEQFCLIFFFKQGLWTVCLLHLWEAWCACALAYRCTANAPSNWSTLF